MSRVEANIYLIRHNVTTRYDYDVMIMSCEPPILNAIIIEKQN